MSHRSSPTLSGAIIAALVLAAAASLPVRALGQFDAVNVPEELSQLDFMLGSWTVEGAFRQPDHVGTERTLWYVTADGGVTRFDGSSWTAFPPGTSSLGDSVRALIEEGAEPYRFSHARTVTRVQDDFALLVDDGRTGGSQLVTFETAERVWISLAVHAPTGSGATRSVAPWRESGPVFEGRETDRRGERIFRRRYEIVSADHYRIRMDVSFDGGTTWITDQSVREVRRSGAGDDRVQVALTYLRTLYSFDLEATRELLADDLRFRDVTAVVLGGPFEEDGPDDFLDFTRRSSEGSSDAGFDLQRAFAADDWVVLSLTYFLESSSERLGLPGDGEVTLRVAATTVLRIDEDGRVAEHRDYVDYEAMNAQLDELRRERGGARLEPPTASSPSPSRTVHPHR